MAAGKTDEAMLRVEELSLRFGGVQAVLSLSFEVRQGEILALIGPNGAGKTCVLNCINGFYRPQKGNIYFEGQDITSFPPHKIAEQSIGRTFQNIQLYSGMSVLDNLMAGRHNHMKENILTAMIHFGWVHQEEVKHRKQVEDIIDFLEIEAERYKPVGMLPYGTRKKVDLGRALALEPKLLLLDEPMAGMNVEEKEDIARYILDIVEEREGTVLLVEHDMGVVMDIADRVIALDFGELIGEGSPAEIKANPSVIEAYLGKVE
ncbi:MAG: ABC transporter ATP-binding protein [Dehalococcoidia bacterium]|nr:ABC transporter ATP-binding protein [Dehalococcoidia bacterium]